MIKINNWIYFLWAWNLSFMTQTDSDSSHGMWIKCKFEKFEIKEGATFFICSNTKSLIGNKNNVKQYVEIKLWQGGSSSRNLKYNNYAQK